MIVYFRFLRVNPNIGLFFFDSRFRPVPLEQQFIGVKEIGSGGGLHLRQVSDRIIKLKKIICHVYICLFILTQFKIQIIFTLKSFVYLGQLIKWTSQFFRRPHGVLRLYLKGMSEVHSLDDHLINDVILDAKSYGGPLHFVMNLISISNSNLHEMCIILTPKISNLLIFSKK